jgi:hypothetical protein
MADNRIVADNGIAKVQLNIEAAFKRRKNAALVLCKKYALVAQQQLLEHQGTEQLQEGAFWTNRTSLAVKGIVPLTDQDDQSVYFGLAHTMEYGKYLELANNREHESLRPVLRSVLPDFMQEVRKLYED